jgi:hypothetical protein
LRPFSYISHVPWNPWSINSIVYRIASPPKEQIAWNII